MDSSSKTTQSGTSLQSGRGKNKRFWKREEEEARVQALVELSRDPKWKAEGNFKNGYMDQLAIMVNEMRPNCGLKVNPHIESKVKWFKDKYNVLNEMLGTSGFKWDDENKMLKCERKNYESYCTGNKNAQGLWRVPFPFLEQLDLVFGLDRAAGDVCEDVTDAVNNMEKEGVNIEGDEDSDDDNESVAQSIQRNPPPTTSKKVRKENIPKDKKMKMQTHKVNDLTPTLNNMASDLSSYMKDMTTNLSTIASAMSVTQQHEQAIMVREQELVDKKKNLLNDVINISGLTRFEAMMGAKMLASDHNSLELFYQSPDDRWKKEFILGIIGRL